jgi:ribosomal protein S18 acetylase RimI-like enzyme
MAVSMLSRRQPAAVDIRRAQFGDIPTLIDMKLQMAIADGAAGLFDATAAEWARDCLGPAPRFTAIVAEHAGAVVGMVIFNEQGFAGWSTPPLYVQDIFVMPSHRRLGIGRALLVEVANEAQRRNSRLVYLNVHEENSARRLYDSLNFKPAERCLVYALMGPPLTTLAGN